MFSELVAYFIGFTFKVPSLYMEVFVYWVRIFERCEEKVEVFLFFYRGDEKRDTEFVWVDIVEEVEVNFVFPKKFEGLFVFLLMDQDSDLMQS